jgi:bifunctional non-homologous end joining protein LigD
LYPISCHILGFFPHPARLDWTHKYPTIAEALASIDARQANFDGELCGAGPDRITSFSIVQLASDSGNAATLVFFLFDLLHLDGEDLRPRPLSERKDRSPHRCRRPAA